MQPEEARIQSISRAKALLDVASGGEWVELRDFAARTGLAKTTAYNLLTALVDVNLLEKDLATGAYRLGVQHLVYGKAVERRLDIAAVVRPHLMRLCALSRETVNLALPGPTDVLIVDSLEGTQSLRVSSYAGTRAPYHSTACGRALLAFQPASFRRTLYSIARLPAATHRTTTDPEQLEAMLESCRTLGWTSECEESELGSACVAAPIFDGNGKAVAAVGPAMLTARFEPEARERLSALLLAELAEVTSELAGTFVKPRR